MTIHLTRSSLRGAAGWLCLRCSRAVSTSLSSPSALRVWRQLHREAHSTARILAPPLCTACMAIASFNRADTPLLSRYRSSLASCNEARITQMSDICNILSHEKAHFAKTDLTLTCSSYQAPPVIGAFGRLKPSECRAGQQVSTLVTRVQFL